MPTLPRNLCRSAASRNRVSPYLEKLEERDAPSASPVAAAVGTVHSSSFVPQTVVAQVIGQSLTNHAAAAPAAQTNGSAVSALFANGDPTGDVHAGLSDAAFAQALQASPNAVLGNSAAKHATAKAASTVALTVSAHAVQIGQRVTLTATVDVYHSSVTPTSMVTFKDGSTILGTVRLDAHGVARLTTAPLAKGTHYFTAVYSGDGHVQGSQSPAASVTVAAPSGKPAVKAAPTVTIQNVGNVAVSDTSMMLVVSVSSVSGGWVTVLDGTKSLGKLDLDHRGQTALALPLGLSAGRHTLTVHYVSADGKVTGSGSLALTLAQGVSRW